MKSESSRPGVIIYFDIRPALERLTDEQRGILLTAILDYAEFGELTELDALTGMCFDMLRPKLDLDAEKYTKSISQRRYAVYVREENKRGCVPLSYNEWTQTVGTQGER